VEASSACPCSFASWLNALAGLHHAMSSGTTTVGASGSCTAVSGPKHLRYVRRPGQGSRLRIAKGLTRGKIDYMPRPSRLVDGQLDRRTDVYAVGVMLWEAIAGERMWNGVSDEALSGAFFSATSPVCAPRRPTSPMSSRPSARRRCRRSPKTATRPQRNCRPNSKPPWISSTCGCPIKR